GVYGERKHPVRLSLALAQERRPALPVPTRAATEPGVVLPPSHDADPPKESLRLRADSAGMPISPKPLAPLLLPLVRSGRRALRRGEDQVHAPALPAHWWLGRAMPLRRSPDACRPRWKDKPRVETLQVCRSPPPAGLLRRPRRCRRSAGADDGSSRKSLQPPDGELRPSLCAGRRGRDRSKGTARLGVAGALCFGASLPIGGGTASPRN